MHAVVVDVTIEDWRGSTKALNERTQPRLSQSRGVIAKVADVAASA